MMEVNNAIQQGRIPDVQEFLKSNMRFKYMDASQYDQPGIFNRLRFDRFFNFID